MNLSKLLPLLAVAVIAGGVFVYLGSQETASGAASASAGPTAVPSPRDSWAAAPLPVKPARNTSNSTSLPATAPGMAEELAAESQRPRQRAVELEAIWSADVYDPATSPVIEEGLVNTLDAERMLQLRDRPTRVTGMDCRATLCRIEAVFAQGKSGNEWATRLLLELGGTFEGSELVSLPGAVGEQTLVVYAYRAGHTPR